MLGGRPVKERRIVHFACNRRILAGLDEKDSFSSSRQPAGKRAAAGTGADNEKIEWRLLCSRCLSEQGLDVGIAGGGDFGLVGRAHDGENGGDASERFEESDECFLVLVVLCCIRVEGLS